MGTDLLGGLRKWEYGEDLANNQEFIILKREGYDDRDCLYPKFYRKVETNFEGSSTKIRNRIREQIENQNKINLGVTGLTTASVIDYIIKNNLYRK